VHRTTECFWRCFENLPEPVQKISKKNFELLKNDPSHTSLHFKKVGTFWSIRAGMNYRSFFRAGTNGCISFWSIRAGMNYRGLAVEDGSDFIWIWIGTYDEYERMIKEEG